MPTASETRPSTELQKLIKRREDAYRDLQAVKRELQAYEEETLQQQREYTAFVNSRPEDWRDEARNPKEGSPSAERTVKLRARLAAVNPHLEEFETKRSAFLEADEQLQTFRRERISDLLDERSDELGGVSERLVSAWQEILDATAEYDAVLAFAQALVRETPGIDGRHLGSDGRIPSWRKLASDTLRELDMDPIVRPSLNELGKWKVSQ